MVLLQNFTVILAGLEMLIGIGEIDSNFIACYMPHLFNSLDLNSVIGRKCKNTINSSKDF